MTATTVVQSRPVGSSVSRKAANATQLLKQKFTKWAEFSTFYSRQTISTKWTDLQDPQSPIADEFLYLRVSSSRMYSVQSRDFCTVQWKPGDTEIQQKSGILLLFFTRARLPVTMNFHQNRSSDTDSYIRISTWRFSSTCSHTLYCTIHELLVNRESCNRPKSRIETCWGMLSEKHCMILIT